MSEKVTALRKGFRTPQLSPEVLQKIQRARTPIATLPQIAVSAVNVCTVGEQDVLVLAADGLLANADLNPIPARIPVAVLHLGPGLLPLLAKAIEQHLANRAKKLPPETIAEPPAPTEEPPAEEPAPEEEALPPGA